MRGQVKENIADTFGIAGLMMERCQEKDPDVDMLALQIYHITQQLFPNCDQWH